MSVSPVAKSDNGVKRAASFPETSSERIISFTALILDLEAWENLSYIIRKSPPYGSKERGWKVAGDVKEIDFKRLRQEPCLKAVNKKPPLA